LLEISLLEISLLEISLLEISLLEALESNTVFSENLLSMQQYHESHRSDRPNPDELLQSLQAKEQRSNRGSLKLFLGMSPGVGKTFAMLQEAQKRLREGVDVVVGYVETHGRKETEELTLGLPVVARAQVAYRDTTLEEFDLDAALARKPQILLVDELAHSNAPGSRHLKRYQDVLELLEQGIDVYSTLNVQHLESRADTVRMITGVTVRETVPDVILERADEIELVDVSPEELLERLREGKVYTPEKSAQAVQHFFRKGNLTALREMALRVTAERVDTQLNQYMSEHRIAGPWKSGDRLLVAVSASPYSEQLVRWTRRMAYTMKAPWIALSVETSRTMPEEHQRRLAKHLALARELGAEIVTVADDNIVRGIITTARRHNVSQIVVGKPYASSGRIGGTIVDNLIEASGTIDLHVVRMEELDDAAAQPHGTFKRWWRWLQAFADAGGWRSRWKRYAVAGGLAMATVAVGQVLSAFLSYQAIGLIMLLSVVLSALLLSGGAIAAMASLMAMLWNFFFIPPRFTFVIGSVEDRLTFGLYCVLALTLGLLTSRIRVREHAVRRREERTSALYAFARQLAAARSEDEVVAIAVRHIGTMFDARVSVWMRPIRTPHPHSTFGNTPKEASIVAWVADHNKPAGRFTATLPAAEGYYVPLMVPRNHAGATGAMGAMGATGAMGVLGVLGIAPTAQVFPVQLQLLAEAFAAQLASTLEREALNAEAEEHRLNAQSEHLYATLLNSISHEFRTPIAVIRAAADGLTAALPNDTPQQMFLQEIGQATTRLHRLVGNLLDMTRLESGRLQLHRQWCNFADTLNAAVERTAAELAAHEVVVRCASDVVLVWADCVLLEQAITNILLNAARYTPPTTRIECTLSESETQVVLQISDNGAGVSDEVLGRLFEKFYRAPNATAGGTGLGLSISKGFIEAHGGTIGAKHRLQREYTGLQLLLTLPKPTVTPSLNDEHVANDR